MYSPGKQTGGDFRLSKETCCKWLPSMRDWHQTNLQEEYLILKIEILTWNMTLMWTQMIDSKHKGPPYLSCGAIPLSQQWLHSCWGRRLSGLGGGCRQACGNCANCSYWSSAQQWLRFKKTKNKTKKLKTVKPGGKQREILLMQKCQLFQALCTISV